MASSDWTSPDSGHSDRDACSEHGKHVSREAHQRDARIRGYLEKLVLLLPHYRLSSSLVSAYNANIRRDEEGPETAPSSSSLVGSTNASLLSVSHLAGTERRCRGYGDGSTDGDRAPVMVVRVLGMGSSGLVLYAERQRTEAKPPVPCPQRSSANGESVSSVIGHTATTVTSDCVEPLYASSLNSRSLSSVLGPHPQQQQQQQQGTLRARRETAFGFALKFIDLQRSAVNNSHFTIKHAIREIETLKSCSFFSILRVFNYYFFYSDGTVCSDVESVKKEFACQSPPSRQTPTRAGASSPDAVAPRSGSTSSSTSEGSVAGAEGAPKADQRTSRQITAIVIELEYLNNGDLRHEIEQRHEALERQRQRVRRAGRSATDARADHDQAVASPPQSLNDVYFSKNDITLIFFQILSAIYYLHERQNIMHRDVKSENVMLSGNGTVKLGDFGFSKRFEAASPEDSPRADMRAARGSAATLREMSAGPVSPNAGARRADSTRAIGDASAAHAAVPPPLAGLRLASVETDGSVSEHERQRRFQARRHNVNSFCGTPLYMAPEIWRRERNYSNKIDLFSVGVILYELLTLQHPTSVDRTISFASASGPQGSRSAASNSTAPYVDDTHAQRKHKVRERRVVISDDVRDHIVYRYGEEYYSLLCSLLESNPKRRPSALEVLVRFPLFRAASGKMIQYVYTLERQSSNLSVASTGSSSATATMFASEEEQMRVLYQFLALHEHVVEHQAETFRQQRQRQGACFPSDPLSYHYFESPVSTSPTNSAAGLSSGTPDVSASTATGKATTSPVKPDPPVCAPPAGSYTRVILEGAVEKLNDKRHNWRSRHLVLLQRSRLSFELRLSLSKDATNGQDGEFVTEKFNSIMDIFPDDHGRVTPSPPTASAPTEHPSTSGTSHCHEFVMLYKNGTTLRFRTSTAAARDEWVATCIAVRDYMNKARGARARSRSLTVSVDDADAQTAGANGARSQLLTPVPPSPSRPPQAPGLDTTMCSRSSSINASMSCGTNGLSSSARAAAAIGVSPNAAAYFGLSTLSQGSPPSPHCAISTVRTLQVAPSPSPLPTRAQAVATSPNKTSAHACATDDEERLSTTQPPSNVPAPASNDDTSVEESSSSTDGLMEFSQLPVMGRPRLEVPPLTASPVKQLPKARSTHTTPLLGKATAFPVLRRERTEDGASLRLPHIGRNYFLQTGLPPRSAVSGLERLRSPSTDGPNSTGNSIDVSAGRRASLLSPPDSYDWCTGVSAVVTDYELLADEAESTAFEAKLGGLAQAVGKGPA